MLIGRTIITDTGIRIFDVDGSSIDITAEYALDLATWIRNMNHYMALLDILRRKEVREKLAHPDAQSYMEGQTDDETNG